MYYGQSQQKVSNFNPVASQLLSKFGYDLEYAEELEGLDGKGPNEKYLSAMKTNWMKERKKAGKSTSIPNSVNTVDKFLDFITKTGSDKKLLRHRGVLLLRDPTTGKIFVRKQPSTADGSPFIFAGGGIYRDEYSEPRDPSEEDILSGASREALEELGFEIDNASVIGAKDVELPQFWKDKALKKRGVPYQGVKEHYVIGDIGKKNLSLYGSENDAFQGGDFYDPSEVAKALSEYSKLDSPYREISAGQAKAITDYLLTKTSSQRLRTTVFALDDDNNLLHGFSDDGFYKFPGGGVDPGEDILEAAKRELLEEAGYQVKSISELPGIESVTGVGKSSAKASMGNTSSLTKYLIAKLGDKDTSVFGSEGDAIANLRLAPVDQVMRGLEGDTLFGSSIAQSNLDALKQIIMQKQAEDHVEMRMRERAKFMKLDELNSLKKRVSSSKDLPEGAHYITLPHGRKAVVETKNGKSYIATILSQTMRPPGRDVTNKLSKAAGFIR